MKISTNTDNMNINNNELIKQNKENINNDNNENNSEVEINLEE